MFNLFIKFKNAFGYAWNGFKYAYQTQWVFKVELFIFIIAIPASIYLHQTAAELILMLGSVIFLLIMELINSAIEVTINRIGLEHHPLSGLAKDLGSTAMVVAGLNVVMTFGIIFIFNK